MTIIDYHHFEFSSIGTGLVSQNFLFDPLFCCVSLVDSSMIHAIIICHSIGLGEMATISAVLYANTSHPELKAAYPNWSDRCKQVLKKWRALPQERKGPFLQQARDNRSALRMKKAQQVSQFVHNVICHVIFENFAVGPLSNLHLN